MDAVQESSKLPDTPELPYKDAENTVTTEFRPASPIQRKYKEGKHLPHYKNSTKSLMSTQGHQTAQGAQAPSIQTAQGPPSWTKLADFLNELLQSANAEANAGLDLLQSILRSPRLDHDASRDRVLSRDRAFDQAFDHALSIESAVDRAKSLRRAWIDENELKWSFAEMSDLEGLVFRGVVDFLESYDERVREIAQNILCCLAFRDDDLKQCVVCLS